MKPDLITIITCPFCKHQEKEIIPTNACAYFYQCKSCEKMLKPKEGDCCVFCSYADIPCPYIKKEGNCKK